MRAGVKRLPRFIIEIEFCAKLHEREGFWNMENFKLKICN